MPLPREQRILNINWHIRCRKLQIQKYHPFAKKIIPDGGCEMQIVCKQCNATYTFSENKLPKDKTATAQCKQCGYKIIINPDASSSKPPAAAFTSAPQSAQTQPVSALNREILSVFPDLASYAHYNLPEIFSADKKGRYKHRGNQIKAKILIAVQPTLTRILRPNEQILRVAAGTAYHPIEILFGNGILTMLYNRYAIIATDQRLVMINTNHRITTARHYLFQMPYDEIRKISRGLFRTSLTLTPKTGKRRTFTSMKASLSAELADCIKPRLNPQRSSGECNKTESMPGMLLCFRRPTESVLVMPH